MCYLRQKSAGERARNPLGGLVHHSERGIRYLSIPYKGGWPGQVCRCLSGVEVTYDNAVARSVIGFLKAELVRRESLGRRINDLKLETLGWVGRFNHRW